MRLPIAAAPLAIAVLTSDLGAQAAGRFEGVIRFATIVEGTTAEMVFISRGGKIRTEMNSQHTRMVMISDADAGEAIMVDDKSRTYQVFSAGGDDDKGEMPSVFTLTGARDRIAGYDCVYYHMEMSEGVKADVCAVAGIGVLMGGGSSRSWAPTSNVAKTLGARFPDFARAMREGFVPLKWKVAMPDEPLMTTTATSVERKLVDASLVSVPAGYKRIDLPGDMTRRRP